MRSNDLTVDKVYCRVKSLDENGRTVLDKYVPMWPVPSNNKLGRLAL